MPTQTMWLECYEYYCTKYQKWINVYFTSTSSLDTDTNIASVQQVIYTSVSHYRLWINNRVRCITRERIEQL